MKKVTFSKNKQTKNAMHVWWSWVDFFWGTTGTVQVRKLVDRESQEPLFIEFLKGDLVTKKAKFY